MVDCCECSAGIFFDSIHGEFLKGIAMKEDDVLAIKPTRPEELTIECLSKVSFAEFKRSTHGEKWLISVKRSELPAILEILKKDESLSTKEAVDILRS